MDSIPVGSRLIPSYLSDRTSGKESPFDLEKAHRWFSIETNNGTRDSLEKSDLTFEDNRNLVHTAHTSEVHSAQVGNESKVDHAACMVENAHAQATKAAGETEKAANLGGQSAFGGWFNKP